MKRNIFIFALVIITFSSCLKDEGNYDYTQLKNVTISGLDNSYRFILQVPQTLKPLIKTDIAEDNMTYCWRIGADTLTKTRDFNYTFTHVPATSDPLTLDIYDKTTNVRYTKAMTLSVVSPFYTGWLILANNNGQGELNFQSYETDSTLYQNIYEEVNKEKLTGTPVMVKQINYQDGLSGAYADRVAVVCKDGKSPDLDGTSLLKYKYIEDDFKTENKPSLIDVTAEYYSNDRALNVVTTDGKLYGKAVGSMSPPEDGYFQYPFQSDGLDYRVAPYLVRPVYNSYYYALDELNHRFVYYTSNSLSSKVSHLQWDITNSIKTASHDTIPGVAAWMGGIMYDDDVYAVTNNDGEYRLYRFSVIWDGTATLLACVKLPEGVVSKDSHFALHPISPYLFVSNGNKLQAINLENLTNINSAINDLATYEGDITDIQFAYDANKQVNELGIAVQTSADKSSLLIINSQLTSHGAIIKHFDGIKGKVVSIYRKIM